MKLVSWNVNGIRAVHKKGFLEWFLKARADAVCVQETKAHEDQFPEDLKGIKGYEIFYSNGEKRGYSGVATWTRVPPVSVKTALGVKALDGEGRIIETEFGEFTLLNVYFPNGKMSPARLKYKLDFYGAFLKYVKKRRKPVVFCGDVNTAHTEKDLARPKENEGISGFLPEERKWLDRFVEAGYVDSFRVFEKGGKHYSWWDMKSFARDRNVGWRIDYFFVDKRLVPRLRSARVHDDVYGSDHCPVSIDLDI